jgi:hypothetical protein
MVARLNENVPIYRAPMRAREIELPPGAGAEYAVARGLVGIGPGGGERAARMLHRFATLPDGVFVWTRDRTGAYRLGRVEGPVREDRSPRARAVGISHVRPAKWVARPFAEAEVPPAVARTFARGGRNLQRTHDAEAERLTGELWDRS